MNRRVWSLLSAFCVLVAALPALPPELPLRQCVRELWQSDRGLPQNSVQSMVQSRDGYVWLATQEGLARFDGLRFTLFSKASHPQIPYNFIRSLLEDRSGRIWAGTNEGGLFRVHRDGQVVARPERLPGDVRSLYEDRAGRIWIGLAMGGLACLEGDRLQCWGAGEGFPGEQVLALLADDQDRLLAGTNRGILDGRPPFAPWPGNDHLPSREVTALLGGEAGELWVGTRRGLLHWRQGRVRLFDRAHGLGFDWVWCLLRDRQGSIWVGSNGGGLARIHHDEVVERLTVAEGLLDNGVWSLLEDREGGLWVGGNGGGVARYRAGMFVNLGPDAGLGNGPYSAVCEGDDGRLWVGTWWDGCYVVDPAGVTQLTRVDGLPDNNISSLCADGAGGMWVGTDNGGVVHLPATGRRTVLNARSGLVHNEVYALARGTDGTLWIGSRGGVQGWRNGAWLASIPGLDGIGSRSLLAQADGTLWIGSEGKGLLRWRNATLRRWTRAEGLSSGKIFALKDDGHGGLWIGSQGGGLSHLDASGRLLDDAVPQLSGSPVFQILGDDQGGLWLSGNRGLTVLSASQASDLAKHRPLSGPVRLLGLADGMASEECTGGFQPAGCRTRDGRLYWPTLRAVTVVEPGRRAQNPLPPRVCIEEVLGDGRFYSLREEISLPPGTRTVSIRFAAISHNLPQRVACRYRLDGFDSSWNRSDPPTSRLISYTNLPPGTYRLRIEAANEDGVVSVPDTGLAFTVRPRFHQTGIFRLALGLAFMLTSYFVVGGIRRYLFLLAFWRRKRMVGAYLLEQELGSGGSATVYKARHLLIRSRVVALKRLRSELASDSDQSRRFRREALLIDRINHPGIVRIIERGTHGNTPYIAMEYLEGKTLAERLLVSPSLSIQEIVAILRQIASVLAFIHQRGIVHRDLKPRNIMLVDNRGPGPRVKLLDFGIASAPDHTAMTETGIMLGTLAYLAPEQIQLGQSTPASDMHAFGVIAFEMIAGSPPFVAPTGAVLMREIASTAPVWPSGMRPDCPPWLAHLVMELLEKDPPRRPSADRLLERLEAAT